MSASALVLTVLAAMSGAPAQARDRQVEVHNTTSFPVYTFYGWPQDFLPGTINLAPLAIQPNERRTIEIDDPYDKCMFSFIAEFQKPRDKQRILPRLKPRKVPNPTWVRGFNVCAAQKPVVEVK
ncbi:hypothetical protein [Aureimonas sp. ME7]|uniref:hypothetical protein n=1 Tax=Aureimonas sp. ME7 TaxID=2744252 RepID=UPI0015F730B6|nr:hypothetical protein [Aureimonas sp. ME7]